MSFNNPISPIQSLGTVSVPIGETYGTTFSNSIVGGYMQVNYLSDLVYSIPSGQTGTIEYSGNTIPINFIKGSGSAFSRDVLILNSDNLSSGRRKIGMLVYVREQDQVYQYTNDNFITLWNAATAATGTVVISDFGTTVNNSTVAGQNFINSWTASTIDGYNGVVRSNAVWKKYYGTNLALTGGSYNSGTGTLTLTNITGGTQSLTGFGSGGGTLPYLPLSGGTVTGATVFQSGLTANTISATTYYNLPTDVFVTGGTYTSGNAIFTNNTGGTFTVTGFAIGGGGGQLFYLNLSQSQGSNRLLSTTGSTASEQTTGVTINNGVTGSIASFQSQPLNITLLPGGIWSFYLHSYKQNNNASFNIFVEVYKRTSGGTQTLLFSTDPTPVTTNSPNPSMQLSDSYFSGTTLLVSDSIVATVRATNTSNQPHTITLVTEGSTHYSYVVSTIPTQQGLTCDTLSGCTIIQTIQTDLTNKLDKSGGTISGGLVVNSGLTANTISATTYQNLPSSISGGGTTSYIPKWTGSTGIGNSIIYDTGTNIGIGLTNPGYKLEVRGGITASGPGNLGTFLAIDTSVGGATVALNAQLSTGIAQLVTYSNSPIVIATNNAERMRVTNDGNVGIGTSSPSAKLHVTGNTLIQGGLTANTISATTYQNLPTDIRTTGGTYSNNTFTFTNNTGGTYSVLFNTVTGLTVNGNLTVTGNTSLRALTATTVSATTYQNLPFSGTVVGTGASDYVTKWNPTGDGLFNSQIYDTGAFIGINTTTPTYGERVSIQTGNKGITIDGLYVIENGSGSIAFGTTFDYSTWGSGGSEIAIGPRGVLQLSQGETNIGIGDRALQNNVIGNNNIAIGGTGALTSNISGSSNIAIGQNAMFSNTEGQYNVAIGENSLFTNVDGDNNTVLGYGAGYSNLGKDNVYIGHSAGYNNSGNGNIFIGNAAGYSDTSSSGKLNIGGTLFGNLSSGFIGILEPTPLYNLDVVGNSKITSTKGSVITDGNTSTAFITVSGSNTIGGVNYVDFLRVTNTAAGATNINKTLRVNNTGSLEVINNAYTTTIFSLTDAGVLSTPGGGTSDLKTKKNVEYIEDKASDLISKLKPVKFEFKNNEGVKRHGFIAQDVLEVEPDLVLGDGHKENGTYGLDYDGILAMTVKSLQECLDKIEQLENRIKDLENR